MNCIISCIILNYNDAPTTIKLLEEIRNYNLLDYIVVVDNHSTDGSWNALKKYANEKIRVIRTDENGGYGAGNNFGMRYSVDVLHASYSVIANPDVYFSEDCIRKFLLNFQGDSSVAIVAAKQSNSTDYAWKDCGVAKHILSTSLLFCVWLRIRSYSPAYYEGKAFIPVFAVPGSLLMVDLKKMLECGMYDEDFFLYYEEFILGHKCAKAQYKTILRLDCSYIHDHHISISKTYRRWSQQHVILLKSAELFLRKYKRANIIQMFFAKIWFMYTKMEFLMYDVYCMMRGHLCPK